MIGRTLFIETFASLSPTIKLETKDLRESRRKTIFLLFNPFSLQGEKNFWFFFFHLARYTIALWFVFLDLSGLIWNLISKLLKNFYSEDLKHQYFENKICFFFSNQQKTEKLKQSYLKTFLVFFFPCTPLSFSGLANNFMPLTSNRAMID
jgi:hypothetical protein